jgi:hypothetical protein
MTRPSDAAIARAFWEMLDAGTQGRTVFAVMLTIENRASAIDAEAKDVAGETGAVVEDRN